MNQRLCDAGAVHELNHWLRTVGLLKVNRVDGLKIHESNNNITHYLCWSKFMQKYCSWSSHVYCVFAKSTNRNS